MKAMGYGGQLCRSVDPSPVAIGRGRAVSLLMWEICFDSLLLKCLCPGIVFARIRYRLDFDFLIVTGIAAHIANQTNLFMSCIG